MLRCDHVTAPRDVTLHPGEWVFGGADLTVRTLVGSCVAVTFWHPQLRIGGMCHYLVPERGGGLPGKTLDGKYGTEALLLLSREVERAGTRPRDYVVKLFGGGDMFPGREPNSHAYVHVGAKNVAHGQRQLSAMGYVISVEDVTGNVYRTLHFEVATGDVWMRVRGVGPAMEPRVS